MVANSLSIPHMGSVFGCVCEFAIGGDSQRSITGRTSIAGPAAGVKHQAKVKKLVPRRRLKDDSRPQTTSPTLPTEPRDYLESQEKKNPSNRGPAPPALSLITVEQRRKSAHRPHSRASLSCCLFARGAGAPVCLQDRYLPRFSESSLDQFFSGHRVPLLSPSLLKVSRNADSCDGTTHNYTERHSP